MQELYPGHHAFCHFFDFSFTTEGHQIQANSITIKGYQDNGKLITQSTNLRQAAK